MKPSGYKINEHGSTVFQYDALEILPYIKDKVGWMLLYRNDSVFTYYNFYTEITLDFPWSEVADGKMPTDDEIVNPPVKELPTTTQSFLILDMTDDTNI